MVTRAPPSRACDGSQQQELACVVVCVKGMNECMHLLTRMHLKAVRCFPLGV